MQVNFAHLQGHSLSSLDVVANNSVKTDALAAARELQMTIDDGRDPARCGLNRRRVHFPAEAVASLLGGTLLKGEDNLQNINSPTATTTVCTVADVGQNYSARISFAFTTSPHSL